MSFLPLLVEYFYAILMCIASQLAAYTFYDDGTAAKMAGPIGGVHD